MTDPEPKVSHFESGPIGFELEKGEARKMPYKPPRKRKPEEEAEAEDEEEEKDAGCPCCVGGCDKAISAASLWTKASTGKLVDDKALEAFLSRVNATLRKQIQAVIVEIRKGGVPNQALVERVVKLLDDASWDRDLQQALSPYIRRSVDFGHRLGMDELGKLVSSPAIAEIGLKPEELRTYAEQATVRLANRAARGVNQRTAVRLGEILGDGVQQGETTSQLTRRVREWAAKEGDEARGTRARAETIARTEAARAASESTEQAWSSSGLVQGKRWLLAPDPCEFCEAAAELYGQEGVGLRESFFALGSELKGADGGTMRLDYTAVDGPPLHPRCRCAMVPVLIDDYKGIVDEALERMEARRRASR